MAYAETSCSIAHENIQEAAEVADFLAQTDYVQNGSKILLEGKALNHTVMGVFLNDPSAIIQVPDQNPALLQSQEASRRFAQEKKIEFIAMWSKASRIAVEKWGLLPIAQVRSYTFYDLNVTRAHQFSANLGARGGNSLKSSYLRVKNLDESFPLYWRGYITLERHYEGNRNPMTV